MVTRIDKAIVAGVSAGAGIFGYSQSTGDPHGYGLVAAVVLGVVVAVFTFAVPNKPAEPSAPTA